MERIRRTGNAVIYQVGCGADGRVDLRQMLKFIASKGISSVLVEGGATIHGAFLRQQLVDHVNLFIAPIFAGNSGVSVIEGLNIRGGEDVIRLHNVRYRRLEQDIMVAGDVVYGNFLKP